MTRSRSRALLGLVVTGLFMTLAGWPATALIPTAPTLTPTPTPTARPTAQPTARPTTSPTPTPTARPTARPTVDVEIVAITPQVLDVTGEEPISVVVQITNVSTTTVAAGRATLSLAARNMRTRADVDRWAAGTLDVERRTLVEVDLPGPLAPETSVEVPLTVAHTARQMLDDGRLVNEWGPRGLVVEVDDGTTPRTPVEARTFLLVKSNQDIPQAPVALLAALTGPPVAPTLPKIGDGPARTLDQATGDRLAEVTEALASSPQVGLAVDPALTADDAGLLAAVQDRWEVLTLPWGDPDLQALAQAQTWDLLTRARQLANTDGPDRSVVWSVDPVDAATAAAVRATGATWIVAPPSAVGTLTQVSTPDGDLTVLSPDETVSALFDGSSDLGSAQAQQQALALLATAARGPDQRSGPEPVLVATGRDWTADADWTQGFVTALSAAPWVRLTTTTSLPVGRRDLPRATTDAPATAPDTGLDALEADRRDLAKFATVTERPGLVTNGVDQAALLAASYAWRADPNGRPAAVTALREAVAQRRNALYLTKRTDLTLLTKKGDVRFNIRNDLPVAATVRVRLEPEKACLRGGNLAGPIWSPEVTAAPNTDTPVAITLYAQANCQVTVQATLVGANGVEVTNDPVEWKTKVRAQFEIVGTAVVGVLLGLGLVLGVVRTVRRGQSGRRGDRTTTDPVRLGVLGGETPIAGIPMVKLLTPIAGIPTVKRRPDPPDETT
ncbi:MAG: DUF6049 family protein [Micrococcales bacterium]|nr:DUF6049 family protein [Micrococcales bacterium]